MKRFPVKAATQTDPATIEVIGQIGASWWDLGGIEESDFRASIGSIPKGTKFRVLLNSDGGSVDAGLGMYNALKERREDATVEITGAACSIATVLMLGAGKVIAPETSTLLIHKPWGGFEGNADEFRDMADWLDKKEKAIIAAYREKTGKSDEEIAAALRANTKFTGAEAVAWGLADSTTSTDVTASASATLKSSEAIRNSRPAVSDVKALARKSQHGGGPAQNEGNRMNKQAVLAALKKLGVTLADAADDAALRAAILTLLQTKGVAVDPNATSEVLVAELEKLTAAMPAGEDSNKPAAQSASMLTTVNARIAELEAQNKRFRESQASAVVDEAIQGRKIQNAHRQKWIERALADFDGTKAELDGMESNGPRGAEHAIEHVSADQRDILVGIKDARRAFDSFERGNSFSGRDMSDAAKTINRIITQNRAKIEVMNVSTNTIDSGLQRTIWLNTVLRDFVRILAPMQAFSTVFSDVPLEGAGTVDVPFYALDTTAATSFVEGTGYTTYTNTADATRTVTLNKRYYKSFDYSSSTLRRQPNFRKEMHLKLAAEELGRGIVADVLSVVTVANYPTAAHTGTAAAFDFDDVIDIRTAAADADWPEGGRSMILDTSWAGALLKDARVSDADRRGSADSKTNGMVGKIAGFDVYESSRVPANSEQLSGMIVFPSAILVATAPVEPAPGVRNLLVAYELAIDPDTGIGFSYRHGGNATTDRDQEVIEASYGYAKGQAAALQRIVDSSL
jgi:ATP-dependent protease ClpP protease subunit